MKKRLKKSICFTFLITVSLSWLNASPIVIPENATRYFDKNAMELFQTEWKMKDLLQNTVYIAGDEINVDYWFSEGADAAQIDKARSIVILAFVLRHSRNYVPFPYQALVSNMAITWETVSCRVFRGEELIVHERYDDKHQLIR